MLQKNLEKLTFGPPSPRFKPPPPPKPTSSHIYDFPVIRKISREEKQTTIYERFSDSSFDSEDEDSIESEAEV